MAVRWHKLLNVGLRQLFSGTCYDVLEEVDVSNQEQKLDFAVIRRSNDDLPEPNPEDLPDGLQNLQDHNVISYKSMHEAFDHFALMELTSHVVTYSKLKAKADWRKFSTSLGVFAISTRKPSKGVVAELLQETETEAVYLIETQGFTVTCIVINQATKTDHNWLWRLMRSDKTRWKTTSFTAMVNEITNQLKQMGHLNPEDEAFENQLLESWAEELSPEKMKQLSVGQALMTEMAEKMLKEGMSTEQAAKITGLPIKVVKELQSS